MTEPGHQAREVGGYRLLRRIGSGGMGTVHEAVDADGRRVALKVLHPHIGMDPQARRRLAREVSLLHRVRDAGVARVLDAEVEDAEAFVVTELIDGPTLEEDVAADGPFDPDELANLAHGLAEALRAIHAVGVVHRDLKPGNVMMSEHGPVVIDFGIAQVVDDARLTQTGMVTGTPGYLDPEVVAGAEPGPVCDWWGWAAVLVFAATARPPFGRGPTGVVLARVATGQVDTEGLPGATARALRAALDPDPARRLGPEGVLAVLDGTWDDDRLTQVIGTTAAGTTALADPSAAIAGADATSVATTPFTDGTRATGHEPRPVGAAPVVGQGQATSTGNATRALPAEPATRTLPAEPAGPPPPTYPVGRASSWAPVEEPPTRALPPVPAGPGPGHHGLDRQEPFARPYQEPYPGQYPLEPARPPAWAVPPRRRTLTVAAVGLGVSAAAASFPGLFVLVAASLLVVTATTGWAGRSRRSARLRRGARSGDDARMLAGLPWHLVRGVLTVLPGAVLGMLLGGATWWVVDRLPLTLETGVQPPLALLAGALVALLAAWLTPTSRPAREGARAMVDVLTPTAGFRALLVVLVLGVAAVVAVQVALGAAPAPDWSPLPEPPVL